MSRRAAVAWRIVADTAAYRVRKREGGNLVTSATLAAALSLPPLDIGYRIAFGLLLNLWVYLVNDCFDVAIDIKAPGRDRDRVRLLSDNRAVGWAVSALLGVVLAAMGAVHGAGLLIAFGSTAVVIIAYSGALKRWPVADLLAMTGWGVTMALVGFPVESRDGWLLAGLLGILCTITQAVQVTRDVDSDREAGLRTSAVVFGTGTTQWIARILVLGAAAWTFLLLDWRVAPALLLAAFIPFAGGRAERAWDVFRGVFGLSWLAILALYRWDGALHGWLGAG